MKVSRLIVCVVFLFMTVPVFAQTDRLYQDGLKKYPTQYPDVLSLYAQLQDVEKIKARQPSPLTTLQATVRGTFWRNPEWAKTMDLSSDQQKKMDEIFQQYRLKLIDLTAALQKEELILEPLVGSTRPAPQEESKILSQIDRIADARAELEKANSRMLVGILQVLTPEQWNKLPMPTKKGILAKPVKRAP